MSTAVSIFFSVLALFVAVWVIIFGGTGAFLARARQASALTGFAWGALLGPLGWLAVYVTTRRKTFADVIGPGRPDVPGATKKPSDHHEEVY